MSTEIDRSIATRTAGGRDPYLGRFAGWALTLAVVTYAYQALMVRYFGGGDREAGGRDQGP